MNEHIDRDFNEVGNRAIQRIRNSEMRRETIPNNGEPMDQDKAQRMGVSVKGFLESEIAKYIMK